VAERRHDERNRLRDACTRELEELREADEDETSEVVLDMAAQAAARTARQLSKPDSDAPPRQPWHLTGHGRMGAALVALISIAAAIVEALRQAGLLK
jgi:hypothetical protein